MKKFVICSLLLLSATTTHALSTTTKHTMLQQAQMHIPNLSTLNRKAALIGSGIVVGGIVLRMKLPRIIEAIYGFRKRPSLATAQPLTQLQLKLREVHKDMEDIFYQKEMLDKQLLKANIELQELQAGDSFVDRATQLKKEPNGASFVDRATQLKKILDGTPEEQNRALAQMHRDREKLQFSVGKAKQAVKVATSRQLEAAHKRVNELFHQKEEAEFYLAQEQISRRRAEGFAHGIKRKTDLEKIRIGSQDQQQASLARFNAQATALKCSIQKIKDETAAENVRAAIARTRQGDNVNAHEKLRSSRPGGSFSSPVDSSSAPMSPASDDEKLGI